MKPRDILFIGDTVTLAIITVIGFTTHGEAQLELLPRMLTTFVPLLAGWFLAAPWLGLFNLGLTANPRQLWRPVFAMLLGAPLAGVLRSALLGGTVLPLFVLILGAASALGMLLWRAAWLWVGRRA